MNAVLPRANTGSPVPRRGFTLVELLVVLGLIAILAGLALPAVQAARESARRAQCLAKLGQLSRSVHLFEAANGGFPMASFLGKPFLLPKPGANNGKPTYGTYPYVCKLLPYLDQAPLFNSINFDQANIRYAFDQIPFVHATAQSTRIETFICPSEVRFDVVSGDAPLSYRGNYGLLEWNVPSGVIVTPPMLTKLGAICPPYSFNEQVAPISFIRDGLSSTLLFSEKPIGSGPAGEYQAFRDWTRAANIPSLPVSTADLWLGICSQLVDPRTQGLDAGSSWMRWGIPYTLFSPNDAPNGRVPDCGSLTWRWYGVFTARSYHPGGVNAAMCDGSARWFRSSTSRAVWRAIGTANGNELVEW